jgi:hypothetical protein
MGIIRLLTFVAFLLGLAGLLTGVLPGATQTMAQSLESRLAESRLADPDSDSTQPVLGAGYIRASVYAPLTAGVQIAVEPPDLSGFSQDISDKIIMGLKGRGFTVDAQADTVLSFRADDVFVEEQVRRPVQLEGQVSNNDLIMRDKVQLTFTMPLEGGAERQDLSFTYRLQVTVNDRAGQRIWFGEAAAVAEKGKGVSTAFALIPILVESLGEERKNNKFQL